MIEKGVNTSCLLNTNLDYNTVVGDYINTMETTFDFNFDFYHTVK